MAVVQNISGTSFPRFTVGKNGATVLQGNLSPASGSGRNGDIYLQTGTIGGLWQRQSDNWIQLGGSPSKIVFGNATIETSVAAVADRIAVKVQGTDTLAILRDIGATHGEAIRFTARNGLIDLSTSSTTITDPVDIRLLLQGTGKLVIASQATASLISNDDGANITIKPGQASTGNGGLLTLEAGTTADASGVAGKVIIRPGTSAGVSGEVLIDDPNYTLTSDNSVVTKKFLSQTQISIQVVTTGAALTLNANTQVYIGNNVGNPMTFTLPTTPSNGTKFTIKDGTGTAALNSAITILPAGTAKIDGAANKIINQNYGSVDLLFASGNWYVV